MIVQDLKNCFCKFSICHNVFFPDDEYCSPEAKLVLKCILCKLIACYLTTCTIHCARKYCGAYIKIIICRCSYINKSYVNSYGSLMSYTFSDAFSIIMYHSHVNMSMTSASSHILKNSKGIPWEYPQQHIVDIITPLLVEFNFNVTIHINYIWFSYAIVITHASLSIDHNNVSIYRY